ncbi:MAG: ribosome-associated translation inhibitor RaiA [Immundisolibacterales bacterium]|nr:ribosome-associated translation inhibitor RaiA [Immundisolibacterales bacterium]
MHLNITGRRLEVTEALESYTRTKLQRLERHFDHVTNVHVILSVERERHRAEATVHVTGRELFADSVEGEMYAAIDALADKLDRQIKRYKEKTTDHHRASGGLKSNPPSGP